MPTGYDEVTGMAYSSLLGQIIQPWFYNQLRTEEQLGYAVFAFSDERWAASGAWASCCKATVNSRRISGSVTRPSSRRWKQRLRGMKAEEFAQIQQALINELKQRPQTLSEEASRSAKQISIAGNFAFDSR